MNAGSNRVLHGVTRLCCGNVSCCGKRWFLQKKNKKKNNTNLRTETRKTKFPTQQYSENKPNQFNKWWPFVVCLIFLMSLAIAFLKPSRWNKKNCTCAVLAHVCCNSFYFCSCWRPLVQTPDAAASRLFNVKFGVRGAGQWQRKNMFMEKCEHDTKHGFCFELFFFRFAVASGPMSARALPGAVRDRHTIFVTVRNPCAKSTCLS